MLGTAGGKGGKPNTYHAGFQVLAPEFLPVDFVGRAGVTEDDSASNQRAHSRNEGHPVLGCCVTGNASVSDTHDCSIDALEDGQPPCNKQNRAYSSTFMFTMVASYTELHRATNDLWCHQERDKLLKVLRHATVPARSAGTTTTTAGTPCLFAGLGLGRLFGVCFACVFPRRLGLLWCAAILFSFWKKTPKTWRAQHTHTHMDKGQREKMSASGAAIAGTSRGALSPLMLLLVQQSRGMCSGAVVDQQGGACATWARAEQGQSEQRIWAWSRDTS